MTPWLLASSVVSGFALSILAEARLQRMNLPFLKHAGGEELGRSLFRRFYVWHFLAVPLGIIEFFVIDRDPSQVSQLLGCLLTFMGLSLRTWSMHSLGRMWSRYCIYIYGVPKVESGPYRFCAHPEYLSRFLEITGIALVLASYYSGFMCQIMMVVSLAKMLPLERLQIQTMAYQNLQPPHFDSAKQGPSAVAN
ncbi:isoprenylcysteine carboxylmethyltransferase family protein [Pseudobacteriovorax antillogorgiicola]|uniref:Alkylresorcinol O-methyltransferase n=1 Tax=Pseudobacteriovorax antillogorgiicola TaxID=1513793 RepID=A0A1Y6B536_9BACT|nr:isoprenylcysteine carboxylmethyltransferase family protein [Pseudobacteriovorax antillogorgiicola]TCS59179.1 alkylresorcinol O-methyltransferase [Pseudobacteriovorax antillogorgiicola]SME90854.1 alkylresorcinol O-methyltransferase [Pseudobacteriovorax antillogorgiicola]